MSCTLLDLNGGTFTGHASSVVTVNGNTTTPVGATVTDLHVVQGDGNAAWQSGASNYLSSWTLGAGATVNRTANVYTKKLTIPSDGTLTANSDKYTFLYQPANDDFWDVHADATITSGTRADKIRVNASRANSGNLKADDVTITANGASHTLTQSGGMEIGGTLTIAGVGDTQMAIVANTGTITDAGDVVLGAADTKNGTWDISAAVGVVTMASLANDTATGNAFTAGAMSINLSGTINGTGITVTANGANLHAGTIQNANSTGIIHCWGVTDGGSNSNDVVHEGGCGISNPLAGVGGIAA